MSSLEEDVAEAGTATEANRQNNERRVWSDGSVDVALEVCVVQVLVYEPEREEQVD